MNKILEEDSVQALPCQEPADFCSTGLRRRYDFYKDPKTGLSTGMTVEMNAAMCNFLLLELQMFDKIKHFYMNQVQKLPPHKLNAIAKGIRDEFPMDKFNALLQELFDACMAQSEGNCEHATELTKNKFEDIETWHGLVNEENLPYPNLAPRIDRT